MVEAGGGATDWAIRTEVWCLHLRQLGTVLGAGWNAQTATSRTMAHVHHDCYCTRAVVVIGRGTDAEVPLSHLSTPWQMDARALFGMGGGLEHDSSTTKLPAPPTQPRTRLFPLDRRQTQKTVIGTPEVEYRGTMTMRTARTRWLVDGRSSPVASPPIDASLRAWSARRTVATLQHALDGADSPARP
jgi:hypothetical protein